MMGDHTNDNNSSPPSTHLSTTADSASNTSSSPSSSSSSPTSTVKKKRLIPKFQSKANPNMKYLNKNQHHADLFVYDPEDPNHIEDDDTSTNNPDPIHSTTPTDEELEKKKLQQHQFQHKQMLLQQQHNPLVNFARIFSVHDLKRTIWETYQPANVIGRNIFNSDVILEIRNNILKSSAVINAIDYESKMTNMKEAQQRAIKIVDQMIVGPREPTTRGMAYIIQRILHQIYGAIHVVQSDRDMLKKVAKTAQENNHSLVFLPTHKSHIDYLVLGLLWFHENISLPFVAAGDNLNMPLVGRLLQRSGAFFIKRPFPDDAIYKAVFSGFITEILLHGYNLEFFLEGGRSRTGKLLVPRMGMLRVILNSYLETKKDCLFVPISISYEKVIETETYIEELLGKSKQPESLQEVIRAAELLRFNFGQIDIRIGEPKSLQKLINEKKNKRGIDLASNLPDLREKSRRQLTYVIAYTVMHEINSITCVTPSALVVTILLTHQGRGISRAALIKKVDWLKRQILERGGHLSAFAAGNSEHVVDKVTFLLRNLIIRENKLLETVYKPNKRFQLSYYRNTALNIFVPESTMACAVYPFVSKMDNNRNLKTLKKRDLYRHVRYLSKTLKWEFIYKPSQNFDKNFEETFDQMLKRKLLAWDEKSDVVTIPPTPEAESTNQFLCFLLWPFIEAYWMVYASLWALFPNHLLEQKSFLQKITLFGETLYHQGELSFYESISNDMTRMALQRCIEENILEQKIINDKGLVLVTLKEPYCLEPSFLIEMVERIGTYRRYGKYSKGINFSEEIRLLANLIAQKKSRL